VAAGERHLNVHENDPGEPHEHEQPAGREPAGQVELWVETRSGFHPQIVPCADDRASRR
jgi:hypothetical protein